MKNRILFTVLALSLLVLAAASYAGTGTVLTAKVPFAFTAGQKSVPAGDYTIYEHKPGLATLEGPSSKHFIMTNAASRAGEDRDAKLVFHRYGDQYFLSEVFDGMGQKGFRIPTSKLEKEYIREGSNRTAANVRRPDVVVYALAR